MAKRQTDEERVVNYFTSAEYSTAKTVFNIVRGIVKRRAEEEEVVSGEKAPVRRRARKVRTKSNAQPSAVEGTVSAA
jgi:hypothetical protein